MRHTRKMGRTALSALACALILGLAGCGGGGGGTGPSGSNANTSDNTGNTDNTGGGGNTAYRVQANYTQGTVLEYATSYNGVGGILHIELGAPAVIGGKTLYAVNGSYWRESTGTQPITSSDLRWKFLGSANGAIIGSADGSTVQNVYGLNGTEAQGMFQTFSTQPPGLIVAPSPGAYGSFSAAVMVGEASSNSPCSIIAGQRICTGSFAMSGGKSEYFKNGIGFVWSYLYGSVLTDLGASSTTMTYELVRSTLAPADGSAMPDFRSTTVADAPAGALGLVGQGSQLYAFGSDGVHALDLSTNQWTVASSTTSLAYTTARSVGPDRIAVVGGLANIAFYQPSTRQWTQAPAIPAASNDTGGITIGGNPAPVTDAAVWNSPDGQAHLLVTHFIRDMPDKNSGMVHSYATVYDQYTNSPIVRLDLGVGESPAITATVVGNRIYFVGMTADSIIYCSLPGMSDCVNQPNVFPQSVYGVKGVAIGTKIYAIGGGANLTGTSALAYDPPGRGVQVFDTANPTRAADVLPPLVSFGYLRNPIEYNYRQAVALNGKIYVKGYSLNELGIEVYTP